MKLAEIYRQIPSSTCPPNCGECCGPVYPSQEEIRNIKAWLARKGLAFKDFSVIGSELNCPYLSPENNHCEIYEVRPFMCRHYGACEPLICPGCNCLHPLNLPSARYLYHQIYKGEAKRIERHREDILAFVKEEIKRNHD